MEDTGKHVEVSRDSMALETGGLSRGEGLEQERLWVKSSRYFESTCKHLPSHRK